MFFVWRTTRNNVKTRFEIELLKQKNDYEKLIRELNSQYEKDVNKYEFTVDSLNIEIERIREKQKVIYVYREKEINFISNADNLVNIDILSNYISKNDSLLRRFISGY